MGRPQTCLSASGSSCMARPAGVPDASERRSQGVLFTGLLLFALSRTKKAPPARSWGVCHQRWNFFSGVTQWIEHCLRALSPLCSAARPKGALGSVEKSPDWLNLTLAQLPRRKAIARSTPFPQSRTMSEHHTGPVSQTLRATGSTYRQRIGPRGRAGNRDKRRIADDVRWRYDAPGECTLLRVRSPRECQSWL